MLLHHVAANGIEVERQLQTPPNAVEIMRLLLEHGADPDAVCDVRGYFDADGRLAPTSARSAQRLGLYGPRLERGRLVDYALIYAALHGRREAVAFLLDKRPDLAFTEPLFHSTAAGAATWAANDEIAALLAAPR